MGNSIQKYYNKLKNRGSKKRKKKEEKIDKPKNDFFSTSENASVQESEEQIPEDKIKNNKCSKLYCNNIKNKHKLISLFFIGKYDISVYKFSLFILTISLDLLFCCLFDSSSNIRKLYQKQKKFTGKEILFGFYSLLPTYFITKVIDCFMEYKNELENYQKNNNNMKSDNFLENYKCKIKCKFVFYFIICFILTGFAWYVVSLFCSTFPNSIGNLLFCFLFNFIFSFFIPFIYYGIVTIFEYLTIL